MPACVSNVVWDYSIIDIFKYQDNVGAPHGAVSCPSCAVFNRFSSATVAVCETLSLSTNRNLSNLLDLYKVHTASISYKNSRPRICIDFIVDATTITLVYIAVIPMRSQATVTPYSTAW